MENICLACQSCNTRKGHMPVDEFRKLLGITAKPKTKTVPPSLGVRRQPKSVSLGSLLSPESLKALQSIAEQSEDA